MIEVGGLIHEFDIGKTQEKEDDRNSILIPYGDKKCSETTNNKKQIGEIAERCHPFKAIITKMKFGRYIEFFDPSVQPEPNNTGKHHEPKAYPKNSQRCRFSI